MSNKWNKLKESMSPKAQARVDARVEETVNNMNEDKTMKKVLPKIVEDWIGAEDICFVTGKVIGKNDLARFTYEFDAWVSEEGQRIVEERATSNKTASMMVTAAEKQGYQEAYLMQREWYAQDAAAAGRDEDYMDADANNDEFRRWHK